MKHDPQHLDSEKKRFSQPSRASSGSAPSSKETLMLGSGLLALTLGIGGMWMISEDQPLHANPADAGEMKQLSQTMKTSTSGNISELEASTEGIDPMPVAYEDDTANSGKSVSLDQTDVFFGFDQAGLSEEAATILQEKIDALKEKQGWHITVQGHTDQHGSDAYNQRLGLRRANAVKAYLAAQGFETSSIETESLGSQNRICTEDSETCFQKNRRAHIILTVDQVSASLSTPLVAETLTTEPETILTVKPDVANSPLPEEIDTTTTALLSTTIDMEPESESTATLNSLP
ncbi:OmpA family protein [Nitrospira sp. M1]